MSVALKLNKSGPIMIDQKTGQSITLINGGIIGRTPNCDMPIAHAKISRKHAQLFCEDGQWYVIDHGSTNFTKVNGSKIDPGQKVPFNDGDTLSFFLFEFKVSLDHPKAQNPATIKQKTSSRKLKLAHIAKEEYSHYQAAGFKPRLIAVVIDNFIIAIATGIINSIAQVMLKNPAMQIPAVILIFSASFFLPLLYSYKYLSKDGQTIGKKVMGVKVIPLEGDLSFKCIFMREYIGRFFLALLFPISLYFYLKNKDKMGLHDSLAKTRVVLVKK